MAKKLKYAFAGASMRALEMYMKPMQQKPLDEYCELVGVYDINWKRAEIIGKEQNIPLYKDFDQMMAEAKPDRVIVTTVDAFHSEYIIRSLEAGADVITEKPMTTDATKCNAILEAERRTGHHVTVTFNYRFAPFMTKIKELINNGAVGDIFSVHFEWLLPRNMLTGQHGTSYFRRWNSIMECSGGLLVHKSTHHFDLVNWWIGQQPKYVSAFGKLNLYGAPGREKYAGGIQGDYCRSCEHKDKCEFYWELDKGAEHYFSEVEDVDHYNRDRCIYSDKVNIYDTMAVLVEYDKGAMMSYSLNATTPYEGWKVVINGSKGRIEAFSPETGILRKSTLADEIKVFDLNDNIITYNISRVEGGHGGGDERLRRMIFIGDLPDPMGHCAGTKDGANSIIIGAAANVSIREKRMVDIDTLIDRYWNK